MIALEELLGEFFVFLLLAFTGDEQMGKKRNRTKLTLAFLVLFLIRNEFLRSLCNIIDY